MLLLNYRQQRQLPLIAKLHPVFIHLTPATHDICFVQCLLPVGQVPSVLLNRSAIAEGYRHIDCASFYGNEEIIGEGMSEFVHEGHRAELFVTSKIWNDAHRPKLVRFVCFSLTFVNCKMYLVEHCLVATVRCAG